MSQTTYTERPAVLGEEGSIFSSADVEIASRIANGAVPVGRVVVMDGDTDCKLPAALADAADGLVLGVALLDPARVSTDFADNEAVAIATKGEFVVLVEQTVVAGDPVFVRCTGEAGNEAPGLLRKDADTDGAAVVPNAKFIVGGSADGKAVVKFA